MNTKEEMIAAVKAHARANYELHGWDFVVECYDDEDIVEELGGATTNEQAIKNIGKLCKIRDDYRKDIQAEAF
jgi:hypothetical protein